MLSILLLWLWDIFLNQYTLCGPYSTLLRCGESYLSYLNTLLCVVLLFDKGSADFERPKSSSMKIVPPMLSTSSHLCCMAFCITHLPIPLIGIQNAMGTQLIRECARWFRMLIGLSYGRGCRVLLRVIRYAGSFVFTFQACLTSLHFRALASQLFLLTATLKPPTDSLVRWEDVLRYHLRSMGVMQPRSALRLGSNVAFNWICLNMETWQMTTTAIT